MQRHVDDARVGGLVTLVARRGRIAHFEACGMQDIASGMPMDRDSVFWLASMTKPITNTAAMILADAGRLRLTDPVAEFIPEFRDLKVFAGGTTEQMALAEIVVERGWPKALWKRGGRVRPGRERPFLPIRRPFRDGLGYVKQ